MRFLVTFYPSCQAVCSCSRGQRVASCWQASFLMGTGNSKDLASDLCLNQGGTTYCCVTLSHLPHLSYSEKWGYYSAFCIGVSGLNEIMHVKYLTQSLAHCLFKRCYMASLLLPHFISREPPGLSVKNYSSSQEYAKNFFSQKLAYKGGSLFNSCPLPP